MVKVFEDEFMDCQADMVSIALEYCENRAERIYIYGSIEGGGYFFNLFFEINNKLVFMNQVNTALLSGEKEYDVNQDKRWEVLDIGMADLQEIERICKKYEKPVPTQFKLFYDVKENNLKAKYKYDLMYSDTYEIDTHDIFMSWYEEIKKEVEG